VRPEALAGAPGRCGPSFARPLAKGARTAGWTFTALCGARFRPAVRRANSIEWVLAIGRQPIEADPGHVAEAFETLLVRVMMMLAERGEICRIEEEPRVARVRLRMVGNRRSYAFTFGSAHGAVEMAPQLLGTRLTPLPAGIHARQFDGLTVR